MTNTEAFYAQIEKKLLAIVPSLKILTEASESQIKGS